MLGAAHTPEPSTQLYGRRLTTTNLHPLPQVSAHLECFYKNEGGDGDERLRQACGHAPEEGAAGGDALPHQHSGLGQALGDVVHPDGQSGQHALQRSRHSMHSMSRHHVGSERS